jgi:hypothetical protein
MARVTHNRKTQRAFASRRKRFSRENLAERKKAEILPASSRRAVIKPGASPARRKAVISRKGTIKRIIPIMRGFATGKGRFRILRLLKSLDIEGIYYIITQGGKFYGEISGHRG